MSYSEGVTRQVFRICRASIRDTTHHCATKAVSSTKDKKDNRIRGLDGGRVWLLEWHFTAACRGMAMIQHGRTLGPGIIGIFLALLYVGSIWGSETLSHSTQHPSKFPAGEHFSDRLAQSEEGTLVSYPTRALAASDEPKMSKDPAAANASFTFWEAKLVPVDWKTLPQLPRLSETARDILLKGIDLGNNPQAFSTAGDCQSYPPVFMGIFENPEAYRLADDEAHLEDTINHFTGSFDRPSASVNNGFNAANILSPLWADPARCQPEESPLECEIRIHKPIVIFINLGTNWPSNDDLDQEAHLRRIVEFSMERGVLPILSTKGDNLEGDHRINMGIAKVASEYDLPLWNFWRSIQYLPGHGIDRERGEAYLSVDAWNRRTYAGLRVLNLVYRELIELGAIPSE